MSVERFAHLHLHTDASPDGLSPVDAMVKQASENGTFAVAMTDHGTLANTVSFVSACEEYGVKPIIGLEAYLVLNNKRCHITINAINETGYFNLIKLNNRAHKRWISGYPIMSSGDLMELNEGLAILTGCPASPIHRGTDLDAKRFLGPVYETFGPERLKAELMFVMSTDFIARPLMLAEHFGLTPLITNDVHYPIRGQFKAHQILTTCRKGYTYDSTRLWLKSPVEMMMAAKEKLGETAAIQYLQNTIDFAESIEGFSIKKAPKLPTVEFAAEKLKAKLDAALRIDCAWRSLSETSIRQERFEYEWSVLTTMGYVDYFFILDDIINFARSNDIFVGPGRGSAGGSYVLYLLGITSVDPIQYDLLFERFINPERKGFPDVDCDFESVRRDEVLAYAQARWGALPVATYSHYSHKSVVRDLGRVLSISKGLTDLAAEEGAESANFSTFLSADPDAKIAYDAMIGQIRHRGKHAGGVVITTNPVPIENTGDELVVAWTEGQYKELSKAGIVKFDLLGLTSLSQLKAMRDITGVMPPSPEDDFAPYEVFRRGDVAGIFQWTGSPGIRTLTMRVVPMNINDLSVINSLYRPGALDAGTADKYPEYKLRPRLIDPRIDDLLADTNGVIVFQEQVMRVFERITGGGLAGADLARRVIVKSRRWDPEWLKEMDDLHGYYLDKGKENGYEDGLLRHVWDELVTHSGYSFNKSHSTTYAFLAYYMAWYKLYYPAAFYTGILRHDTSQAQTFLLEAASKGIKISQPHVNISSSTFELADNTIYIPLNVVKYLGQKGADAIVKARTGKGQFGSYRDFDARVDRRSCNSRSRKLLYSIGGFSGLDGNPDDAIKKLEGLSVLSDSEAQLEALGFIIPTAKIYNLLTKYTGEGMVSGFLESFYEKESAYGKYTVYKLSPQGSFWSKVPQDVKKGDFLIVTKNGHGKAKEVKRAKI